MSELITKNQIEDLKAAATTLMEEKLPKANIIVAGVAGAGKSTLLNAIFGQDFAKTGCGRPITSDIRVYEDDKNDNALIRIWDTMGFELDDKKVASTIKSIKDVIVTKNESKDPFDRIHAIWYCIQATGTRFQNTESKFIKELHSLGVPFIIVMTKCINKRSDDEFEELIKELLKQDKLTDIPIVRVLAKEWEIDDDQVIKPKGLDNLVNLTLDNLESYVYASFIAAQTATKAKKRELAEACIWEECDALRQKRYEAYIPIVNIFSASSHMEKMFKAISRIYNANLKDSDIKKVYKYSVGEWKGRMVNLINPLGNIAFKKS